MRSDPFLHSHLLYHIRSVIPCYEVQESRFSCSIAADNAYLLISLEIVCETVKIAFVAIVEAQVLAVHDLGAKPCGALHGLHADLFLGIDLRCPVLEVIECVYTVACLACTGTWSAADPFQLTAQDVADLVCLGIVIGDPFLALFEIVLVVAFIGIYGTMIHLHDDVAYPVKEITVVCNHEQGTA